MADSERLDSENLREIYQARDEWEGTILLGFLRDNGVEAALQRPPCVSPLDGAERLSGSGTICGIFVLEHEVERGGRLVQEFLAAATDENVLAETAARTLRVDQETIHRLRTEVREERGTFELLGWIGVVFLGAMGALWAIWPEWLKLPLSAPAMRLTGAILLVLAAVFVGNWVSKRVR